MRRWKVAASLAVMGVTSLAGAATPVPGVENDIRRATATLLQAGSRPHGDVHAALRSLIDVAAGLGREARLAAPAQARLDAAAADARRVTPLDDAVRASVADAYAALDEGGRLVFPREVGSIEQARAWGRALVLLVITPMEAPR